ncbi:hypothetical protein C8J40_11010 [Sphingomonas sp. PP-CC-3A-396]|nr:hypothetical protein C8J40_11010 [Sphingomonas sp. PP-CC-3A-396]
MTASGSIPPAASDYQVLQAIECWWPSNDVTERLADTV